MKKHIFLSTVIVAVLSSCSSAQYFYSSHHTTIDRSDISVSSTIVDVKADFTKRIEATSSWCDNIETAKLEAQYLAITKNKIDIVVDPIYKITETKGQYQVTLHGFAGYYTNSRTFYEDLKQLREIDREDIEKYMLLHNPEMLHYTELQKRANSEIIHIHHYEGAAPVEEKENK